MKTVIKRLICAILFYSGLMHLYIEKCFKRKKSFTLLIINYHRFSRDPGNELEAEPTVNRAIDGFRKDLRFLKKYFRIWPLDKAVDTLKSGGTFTEPTITITVDDGYKSVFELLLPVLKEANTPATVFLTSGLVGTRAKIWVDRVERALLNTKEKTLKSADFLKKREFDISTLTRKRAAYCAILSELKEMRVQDSEKSLKEIERELGIIDKAEAVPIMLDWDEIRIMGKSNISFGAHTLTHPILTNMPLEEAKREIAGSKKIIEEKLGVRTRHFAYPNGRPQDFNQELRQYCKDIGFESISSCDFGNNRQPSDVWSLKRIGVSTPLCVFALNVIRAFLIKNE